MTPKVVEGGTVLRVYTYFPPALTTMRFFEKACVESGVPEFWIHHLLHVGRKEMEQLCTGTNSTSNARVKTLADIKLKFECEQEIVHTVPILHVKTNCTTYLYILRKKRTETDKVVNQKKKVMAFDSDDESTGSVTLSSDDETFINSRKKQKRSQSSIGLK